MNQKPPRRFGASQIVLVLIGIGLCLWAISDDYLIGGGEGFGMAQLLVLVMGLVCLASAVMSSSVRAMVLSTVMSLFFALGAAELVLRIQFAPRFASAFQMDDALLYRLKPGAKREYRHLPANGGGQHVYEVNAAGYRGAALGSKTDSTLRGLVFGDSFIHAEFSTLENTFTEQLERALEQPGRTNVEVINAGVAGYGPDQVALRMLEDIARTQPDFIVVSIFAGNDFGDLVRNKLFRLDAREELELVHPTILPQIMFQAELSEKELLLRKVLRSLRDAFRQPPIATDPKQRIDDAYQQHVDEYEEFVVNGNTVVSELRSDPYSADLSVSPDSPSALYKRSIMAAVMKRIAQQAAAQKVPLMFVLIPHPMDVLGGAHESGAIDRTRWPDYSPDAQVGALLENCTELDLNCLSLMQTMREEGGAALYLGGGDDHWNDLGQAVAAQVVAQQLIRTGVVAGE